MPETRAGASVPRPLIIPLFIPHQGCPHQCVFCNQHAITGASTRPLSRQDLQLAVRRFLKHAKRQAAPRQIAFFGGNFLGLDEATRQSLLGAADEMIRRGWADGIRFSTRPDTVTAAVLDGLHDVAVSTVELGVQSMRDRILDRAGRGHRAADTTAAVGLLRGRGYQVGLQMMVGLPGDDDAGAMRTARRLVALQPDFVRIYPTLVLRGSPLAHWYRTGRYRPMTLDACVDLVKRIYHLFTAHRIPVVRMGLQASDGLDAGGELIAGPYHPAFGHLVHAAVVRDAMTSVLRRSTSLPAHVTIRTHPRMIARVQGLNKANLEHLQRLFGLSGIHIVQDPSLALDRLIVDDRPVTLL